MVAYGRLYAYIILLKIQSASMLLAENDIQAVRTFYVNQIFNLIVSLSESAHKRVVIHIDIDCFYAQVEMIQHPELRHKPLGKKH